MYRNGPVRRVSPVKSHSKVWFVYPLITGIVFGFAFTANRANSLSQGAIAGFASQSWVPRLAQTPTLLQLAQQGTQISLNGRLISAVWSQRQQTIGIADTSLLSGFGVDLMNTSDPAQQPVQWYSQPSTDPVVLGAWLTEQYRYLDLTELAQRAGWQVAVQSNGLQITTPASQVLNIRQGRQEWGDRIVLDLDQATPFQVTETANEFTVVVDAQIAPAVLQSFIPSAGNRLTALSVTSANNQTVIRVGMPSGWRPRVWTLPSPNRLVIDVRPDSMPERDIAWAPGLRWQQRFISIESSRFPITLLEVDLRQPGVQLKPIQNNLTSAPGLAPLSSIAQTWKAAGAINGGFFNRNNQLPLGAIRQDERWISGPILNRGAIAWDTLGQVIVGRLTLQETLTTPLGQQLPVNYVNSGYVEAGLSIYSPAWGLTYSPIIDNETIFTVQNNQIVRQQNGGAIGQSVIPIPVDGYLIVARSDTNAVNALNSGTSIQKQSFTFPDFFKDYPQIMGAGPLLVQNQQIVLNAGSEQFSTSFSSQAAIRSAIGKVGDGKLVLVTVQNRIGGRGPTLREMAQIMLQLGSSDALNLDGGSSTSLYLGGQLLNRSSQTAARVNNGIGVFIQPNF